MRRLIAALFGFIWKTHWGTRNHKKWFNWRCICNIFASLLLLRVWLGIYIKFIQIGTRHTDTYIGTHTRTHIRTHKQSETRKQNKWRRTRRIRNAANCCSCSCCSCCCCCRALWLCCCCCPIVCQLKDAQSITIEAATVILGSNHTMQHPKKHYQAVRRRVSKHNKHKTTQHNKTLREDETTTDRSERRTFHEWIQMRNEHGLPQNRPVVTSQRNKTASFGGITRRTVSH